MADTNEPSNVYIKRMKVALRLPSSDLFYLKRARGKEEKVKEQQQQTQKTPEEMFKDGLQRCVISYTRSKLKKFK